MQSKKQYLSTLKTSSKRTTIDSNDQDLIHHCVQKIEQFQLQLCNELNMKGRIILSHEGINGTLSASSEKVMDIYISEMKSFNLYKYLTKSKNIEEYHYQFLNVKKNNTLVLENTKDEDIDKNENENEYENANEINYIFSGIDWKKSQVPTSLAKSIHTPFPDLKISIQNEIVRTGNIVNVNDFKTWGGSHLSPEQFHDILTSYQTSNTSETTQNHKKKDLVLIDVRNTFEHAIGHFTTTQTNDNFDTHHSKIDHNDHLEQNKTKCITLFPKMTNFASFDTSFCAKHVESLKDKKVLLYCTGGIRCEKASVMLKKRGVHDVSQLSGGIHRYLEKYGSQGFFKGKNFVFDQRVALPSSKCLITPLNHHISSHANVSNHDEDTIVGQCVECSCPYDDISGSRLCTVCRDLVLVCRSCQNKLYEYHCEQHSNWKLCYFTFLDKFSLTDLHQQIHDLETIISTNPNQNKKVKTDSNISFISRNVRKTLTKQIEKVRLQISKIESGQTIPNPNAAKRCRTCFLSMDDGECDGLCWGFWKKK